MWCIVVIEVTGNLWTYPADVRVITTNGFVKRNGECVMGAGCALEAKTKWSELPKVLGDSIRKYGNVVTPIRLGDESDSAMLFAFPVKHNWFEKADIELIRRSAEQLVNKVSVFSPSAVVMPRPGCGNGGLRWEDVKPVIEPILDDRFHVITF